MLQGQRLPDPAAPPPAPRWARVFWIIGAVLVAAFVVLHLTGHGLGALHAH